jgi:hypothetical protein
MKRIAILCIALVLALALVIPSATYAAKGKPFTIDPPPNIRPIIYFHGAAGSAAQFETQAMRFMSNGYPSNYLAAFEYSTAEPVADMEAMNQYLDDFIDALLAETGAEQVDVMGKTWPGAYPSPAYPGLTMNYMASSPERAAKIAHAAYTDSALSGYTAIVPTLGVWGLSGFGGFEREIIGAENIYLPLHGHVQTCTSVEAFVEIFKFFTGQEPTTTDIVPEPPGQVRLAGKALLYQQNIGPQEDSTLEIWEVDGDTGFRMGEEPNATYDLGEDGAWGPFNAEGGTHYEFTLVREGSVQHFYYEPYFRSSYFVRLTTSPVGGGIGAYIQKSDHHSAMNIIRYKEIWGDQGVNNDAITIIDSVNNVNVITPITCPSARSVISFFLFDNGSDGVTNINTVPFPFGFIGFMSASDVYMPAVDPPDGTISIVLTPRDGGGKTQVVNVPNWISLTDRITVQFREYVQDINTFEDFMRAWRPD